MYIVAHSCRYFLLPTIAELVDETASVYSHGTEVDSTMDIFKMNGTFGTPSMDGVERASKLGDAMSFGVALPAPGDDEDKLSVQSSEVIKTKSIIGSIKSAATRQAKATLSRAGGMPPVDNAPTVQDQGKHYSLRILCLKCLQTYFLNEHTHRENGNIV
jgi:hypothetical protein